MKQYRLTMKKMAELFPSIEQLEDGELAHSICEIWSELFEQSEWESLEQINFCPGVNDFSLVGHINVTIDASLKVVECIEAHQHISFDRQLLIALGLLHDVSKLVEYRPDHQGGSIKTELGEKLQHGAAGAMLAQQKGLSLDLVHLILTHTPMSKMKPTLKEGILFCYVDLADADMLFLESGNQIFLGK